MKKSFFSLFVFKIGKLSTSAWDLSTKKLNKNPTSGFSGTNEKSLLLPLDMSYYNVPGLRGTNGCLISQLLKPENDHYFRLRSNANGIDILKKISSSKNTRLLLDVGALMVPLTNIQVATEWLEIVKTAEAAVYFDENDLKIIDKKGNESMFEMSPYKLQLDRCLIYLDDVHTRGTDLKIPRGTIGAVTLGKGVTKDRLMQACMRMRMLGDGHSVRFYASNEVHSNIKRKNRHLNKIRSQQVIEWALENSQMQIDDGFNYWANQGIYTILRSNIWI